MSVKQTLKSTTDSYLKKLPEPSTVYVIDFFSGCGGMSWGFANFRQSHLAFNILAGIDIDKQALETYKINIGSPGIVQDIREIARNPELLETIIPSFSPKQNRPLVFIGCAPCQGFSAHRKKDERDDKRNNLLVAFAEICAHFLPDAVVIENVPEILNGKFSHYWQAAEKIFIKSKYLLSQQVLDLSSYGVPQRRRRAVILGGLGGPLTLPDPVFSPDKALTVRDAISHLEPIKSGEQSKFDRTHKAPNHTHRILERIKKTPPDGGDRRDLPDNEQLICHSNIDKGTTPGFTDVYGRLRWDTPSVTITAKSSTPSCGRFLHPEQHRNISVREAAILQGFPQTYEFAGPMVHQYRQIGEAVPPIFAKFLAQQILNYFNPQQSIELIQNRQKVAATKPQNIIKPIVVDCFCGAGGLALGFESAGFETGFAFDISKDAIDTFNFNLPKKSEVISITDADLVGKITQVVVSKPYVIVGGPPCQGFSQQRRGENKDERNDLVLKYADLISLLPHKPIAVVLENVTYLDSPRGKKILQNYLSTLKNAGYTTFRHDLNSADFAVPQPRKRIVIVSVQNNKSKKYFGPKAITPNRWMTIGEVFNSMPDFGISDSAHIPNHIISKEGQLNKRRIAYVDMGKGRLSIPDSLQLDCHKKYGGHLDVFGRLDWFSFARTITGGFDSFTRGEFGHPFYHRSITPREAARIQGFPDWFEFMGNKSSIRSQIGNAVPPPMAYAIALALKEILND